MIILFATPAALRSGCGSIRIPTWIVHRGLVKRLPCRPAAKQTTNERFRLPRTCKKRQAGVSPADSKVAAAKNRLGKTFCRNRDKSNSSLAPANVWATNPERNRDRRWEKTRAETLPAGPGLR